jgi:hypothetical protein
MTKETKIKKLTLNKETLRDLTAHNAGEIKGGARGAQRPNSYHCANTKKCTHGCPSYSYCPTLMCPR